MGMGKNMATKSRAIKWGFGMAPLKPQTELKNRTCIEQVRDLLSGRSLLSSEDIAEAISVVKGLFSRINKQNQWDWFTINMYFDYPTEKDIVIIASALSSLRKAVVCADTDLQKQSILQLQKANFLLYCENYLSYDASEKLSEEYLYILSRKEEPDILKIGMTTRNIQKRVNEINSATGVLYPYSARKVYKVKNCRQVEKDVHQLLESYRIRADREFFKISFGDACRIIENYLCNSKHNFYDNQPL